MHLQQGLTFRKEFLDLKAVLFDRLKAENCLPAILYMTATMTDDYRLRIETLWGFQFTCYQWAQAEELARRNIELRFTIRSCATKLIKSTAKKHFSEATLSKAMFFTNKRSRVSVLVDHVTDAIEEAQGLQHNYLVLGLHGKQSLEDKKVNIQLFCNKVAHSLCARSIGLVSTRGCGDTGVDCCAGQEMIERGKLSSFPKSS